MRQKLLLIAGWAVAAVGSSVVASGAVAVAGGQVTDRPLRLLSASEVEAIPIVNTVALSASGGPPASGGSAVLPGQPGSEDAGLATGTLANRQSLAGDEGETGLSPATGLLPADDTAPSPGVVSVDDGGVDQGDPRTGDPIGTAAPRVESPPPEPIPDPAPGPSSSTQIVTLPGGTAAVAGSDGRVELLWATPRAGYTVSIDFATPDALVVSFTSAFAESVLRAFWSEDGLVVDAPGAIS
jgi:hypothetical protein